MFIFMGTKHLIMPNQYGVSNKNKIIRDLIKKFPTISKKALGELAAEKYPALFNPESARSLVRTLTGSAGELKRKTAKDIIQDKPEYQLPPSKCKEREFVKLPTSSNNILWLSDLHIPNQDNKAIELAIQWGVENKINCVVLGGDILDNTPFTSHDAPPPGLDDVRSWFEYTEQFLQYLRHKFPKAHIVWLEGNHDQWMMRYLMKKAPMLFNDEYYHLPQRLNLKKYSIDFYKEHIVMKAGKLGLHHGHLFMRGVFSPVNAARGLFLRTKANFIVGHVHQSSHHSESNINGEQIGCWSVSCLCTLAPDYDPMNTKHSVGFANIKVEPNGNFTVHNFKILKNKIYNT